MIIEIFMFIQVYSWLVYINEYKKDLIKGSNIIIIKEVEWQSLSIRLNDIILYKIKKDMV